MVGFASKENFEFIGHKAFVAALKRQSIGCLVSEDKAQGFVQVDSLALSG